MFNRNYKVVSWWRYSQLCQLVKNTKILKITFNTKEEKELKFIEYGN